MHFAYGFYLENLIEIQYMIYSNKLNINAKKLLGKPQLKKVMDF